MKESEPITVGIINYGAGNIFSVKNACEVNNIPFIMVDDVNSFNRVNCFILPGVGSFQYAVSNLKKIGIWDLLVKHTKEDKPILGICLGMQLLFKESHENGVTKGLNVFDDVISSFEDLKTSSEKLKIPHMGWTEVFSDDDSALLFSNIEKPFDCYFSHSFSVKKSKKSYMIASSMYQDIEICSVVQKSNIYGVQFHPEKSAQKGLAIYRNFYNICEKWKRNLND